MMSMTHVRFTVRRMMVAVAITGVLFALVSFLTKSSFEHRVGVGENFWTIAKLYYGTGRYYKALWYANRDRVGKINELNQGTTLRIPHPQELDRSLIRMDGITPKPGRF